MAKAKYLELFNIIDTNKDGFIDMAELKAAFAERGVAQADEEAVIFFERSDLDKNKVLDKVEFVSYMENHEREMQVAFNSLDTNKDTVVDANEVIDAFKLRGVNVSKEQVDKLIKIVDADGNHVIDWDEWREFLLFRSTNTIVTEKNI